MGEKVIVTGGASDAVKEIMKNEHLKETDLAAKLGVTKQSVQQSLNHTSRDMRVATLRKILNCMGYELVAERTERPF